MVYVSNYPIHYGNHLPLEIPEGFIMMWGGRELPVGFIPMEPQPYECMGGYLYLRKANNLEWVDWYNKKEGPAWWYERTNRP